ncbi:glycoside hydrolase family 2 TIM barrel-domain containing protein [Gramella sp. AN32]|uniref:Beta-glucuronidase n=1 Tax=Christiangramia antarctica TaxID=2058158 RepID=A0ABW5X325_9FLAO|nr:glycoside hydrolase family 2 TIM barrel-domain containing protein [Gramella sp. AN32]MCM4156718.1 beta-glucuronidase [Gramella sp. AN32]
MLKTESFLKTYFLSLNSVFFLLALLPQIGFTQTSEPLITSISARNSISLDGTWNYIVDPYKTGFRDSKRYDFGQETPEEEAFVEYKFQAGNTLKVPGDWNTQKEEIFYYEGLLWYQRTFQVNKKNNKEYALYFGAANYKTTVFLNGSKIGSHEGGFTPFNFNVTAKLREGKNHIVVAVDNERRPEYVPTLKTDWWNYGGITRSVKLLELNTSYIRTFKVQLDIEDPDYLKGFVHLSDSLEENLTLRIPELNLSKKLKTNESGVAEFSIKAKPQRWSPENPKLYEVLISSTHDTLKETIGFRTIEAKDTEILLNGKSIFLKGISIHEEAPFDGGRVYNEDQAKQLLTWAKELNANYVRLAHYPHNEAMVREADRMGLLVWSEIPVYWDILWENSHSYQVAEQMLTEMITRDQNRASVIIWSVANETPQGEARTDFLKKLITKTKELDDDRLISAALHEVRYDREENTKYIEDELANYVDLLSINNYCGWYGGSDCQNLKWATNFNKPMIMSEYGGGSLQGLNGSVDERWTEEFQAEIYRQHVKMFNKIPFLAGVSPWILKDFRSPLRMHATYQNYWNRKGLISDRGIKKKAFYILQDFYKTK